MIDPYHEKKTEFHNEYVWNSGSSLGKLCVLPCHMIAINEEITVMQFREDDEWSRQFNNEGMGHAPI